VRARVFLDTEFTEGAEEEAGEAWSAEEWRGFVEPNIENDSTVLADCQLIYEITASLFERGARIRMRRAEVERFEGVERGLMGLLGLWKCVEK
jgi:hypothetical protein